ncbi:smad nuclear-interacting protein 1 [Ischnura elegans]|uniref:smad nuclear-interacting protein 1 n=1 Tax=Ischnura elegans TaxID=197161 RepID=UPI001ED8A9E4|nr:smad nuclear-interacting protein 1 [Ischnura elegans]
MREMSSEVRHKRRHRSPSCSSPEIRRKVSHKVNYSDNSSSKYEKKMAKGKYSQKVPSEDLSDSSSDHGGDRNSVKKKKKCRHRRLNTKSSETEEEIHTVSKSNTSQAYRLDDRQKSKMDEVRSRPRETENSRSNHRKEQHRSSEHRPSDHSLRRERYNEEDDGRKRDGGGGRSSDKRIDSSNAEHRAHKNSTTQDHRGDGRDRRRNVGEDNHRESNRRMQEDDDTRRNRSNAGEGSRSGSSRGRVPSEGNHVSDYDRNRPIKKEPGLNNDESENYEWGSKATGGPRSGNNVKKEEVDKDKPNFGLSGKLTEDTNMVNGVVIKYNEPPEARKPRRRWRLYVFKGEENLPTLYLHRQSAFLIGRDRKVCDIPVDHPSCSKQHAAFQFRLVPYQRPNGTMGKRVRPYIIDLESSNGTYVNNNRIDPKKYVELLERDVVKFGYSSREYVLLHEQSKESDADDDDVVGT